MLVDGDLEQLPVEQDLQVSRSKLEGDGVFQRFEILEACHQVEFVLLYGVQLLQSLKKGYRRIQAYVIVFNGLIFLELIGCLVKRTAEGITVIGPGIQAWGECNLGLVQEVFVVPGGQHLLFDADIVFISIQNASFERPDILRICPGKKRHQKKREQKN